MNFVHKLWLSTLSNCAIAFVLLLSGCASNTFSQTKLLAPNVSLRGSTVYVYSFLDIRENELGPKLLDQFDLQLGEELRKSGVTAKVLRFKKSAAGMAFLAAQREEMRRLGFYDEKTIAEGIRGGAISIPVGDTISQNVGDERRIGARYRLVIFPNETTLRPGIMGTSYAIRWDLTEIRSGHVVWSTTSEGRKVDGWKIDEDSEGRAKRIVDGVVSEMKTSGLMPSIAQNESAKPEFVHLAKLKDLDENTWKNLKPVDTEYFRRIRKWQEYRIDTDLKAKISGQPYVGDEFVQEKYYVADTLRIVVTKSRKSGLVVQKQYWKDGAIYIVFADIDSDGLYDVVQYWENGTATLHEITLRGAQGIKRSWFE